jgi:chondroitin AC lyase
LRLFSNRTIGTEMINDENIRGYWLPFGLTVIQSSGTEHQDIYPVWDWSRLPGVTAPQMPPPFTKYLTTNAHEVSVLSTGDVSVGTTNYPGSLVKAQKLWFFLNESMIALGTGITSDEKVTIYTSIEQNLAQDKAI